jgi:hypothetical protein
LKKINKTIFSFVFVFSLSSIIFCDVTSSITSLVGRNAEGYLAPLGTMMGSGMNSGFYRKASPHKILGFDITLDFAYSMAPPGQTTYNFYIPNDSIDFPFQFQFPRSMFSSVMGNWESVIPSVEGNSALYQDQEIPFELAVKDLLNAGDSNIRAQNILGNDSSTVLTVTLDKAIPAIFDQIIDNTWNIVATIPGLGEGYEFIPGQEIKLFNSKDEFTSQFGDSISALIGSSLNSLPMPELPIPGGFGDDFKSLPIDIGLPIPILQASVGLPFHTEITARGLPVAMPIGIGTIKYGGFGGKIGISDYLSDIFYKPAEDVPEFSDSNLVYIIETPPSRINPSDVDNAISVLRLNKINVNEIDSLNYLFLQGDKTIVVEIQSRVRDAQLQLENQPKKKKKKKKFPIDLALGYYTNDLELDFSGATINSTNRMLSLQAGKTLNLPSFLSFLGGVGIYGGVGFESSNLKLSYELANPLAYGCFTGSGDTKQYKEGIEEDACTGTNKNWTTGVPLDISLSFPGDNTFRSLIGARVRILLVDAYVDYNMGNSNNSINAGIGITFR